MDTNVGVIIMGIVMFLIMCSPIVIFRAKGKKKEDEKVEDNETENK